MAVGAEMARVAERQSTEAADGIARELVPRVAAAGRSRGRQAALAADAVRARDGAVEGGGSQSVRRHRTQTVRASDVFFGSEFGSSVHRQFPSPRAGGYWFTPTVESAGSTAQQDSAYGRVLDAMGRTWRR